MRKPRATGRSQFRMIARSVGYRLGKAAEERKSYPGGVSYVPDFESLFAPEYVPDAEVGYDEGMAYVRHQKTGRTVDTFYERQISSQLSIPP